MLSKNYYLCLKIIYVRRENQFYRQRSTNNFAVPADNVASPCRFIARKLLLPSTRTTQSSSYSLTSSPSVAPARLNYERDYASSIFDGDTIPLSSNNRGTKQLSDMAIVHLGQHDSITLVVPPMNPSELITAQKVRSRTLSKFCKVFLEGEKNQHTGGK